MAPDSARYLVASRVAQRAERFPQLFPEQLRTGGLAGRDAALAHAIDQAVARRWLTLAAVLQAQLNRPWERLQPAVQSALLVGAAQLLLLERLPDHAVINESVAWVKR
ncbi:MAG: transcription antitermination factor NusB, partial [Planctomycetota bacterium]